MEIKNKTCWVLAGGLIHKYVYIMLECIFGYVHVYIVLPLLLLF